VKVRMVPILIVIGIHFLAPNLCATEIPKNITPRLSDKSPSDLEEVERNEFVKAWLLLNQGEDEKAAEITRKHYRSGKDGDGWTILLAAIYIGQKKYEEALKITAPIREKYEKVYSIMRSRPEIVTMSEFVSVEFLYYRMLLIRGLSSYQVGNCQTALHELLLYSRKYSEPYLYEYIGACYYKGKEYGYAVSYFKKSYDLYDDGDDKTNAAYNIAALYAVQGNVEQAILWAKIPLSRNRKFWTEQIESDKDFEKVLANNKFRDFLGQQGEIGP
jgi:tetratricopeptide (TPR) repeat protein